MRDAFVQRSQDAWHQELRADMRCRLLPIAGQALACAARTTWGAWWRSWSELDGVAAAQAALELLLPAGDARRRVGRAGRTSGALVAAQELHGLQAFRCGGKQEPSHKPDTLRVGTQSPPHPSGLESRCHVGWLRRRYADRWVHPETRHVYPCPSQDRPDHQPQCTSGTGPLCISKPRDSDTPVKVVLAPAKVQPSY